MLHVDESLRLPAEEQAEKGLSLEEEVEVIFLVVKHGALAFVLTTFMEGEARRIERRRFGEFLVPAVFYPYQFHIVPQPFSLSLLFVLRIVYWIKLPVDKLAYANVLYSRWLADANKY
ncbi:hypothetical protein SDC9_212749 [bioreactor metagenome]|uniref:Uncharacterized protein n=1 Tax=bioreactor metagenome TaxID=1076179 RepID=A0A645JPI8_9ZZZZ